MLMLMLRETKIKNCIKIYIKINIYNKNFCD